jgi:hypothetical protein
MDGRTYTEKQESLRRKIGRMTDPEFREFVSHSPPHIYFPIRRPAHPFSN